MDRKAEAGRSREGLLRSYPRDRGASIPMRKSLEDAYRSDSDSDLDATDYLEHEASEGPAVTAYDESTKLSRIRALFAKRAKCLLIVLVIGILFWSVLAAGGVWLYKKKPADGQSPPWYPTPRGGTVSQWKDSYAKAYALVSKMTLPEKVNVTTGTGWQMGLAVGNTGPAIHVGFPGLALQDGPLGLRFADNATAFPAGITVGATWNKELMYLRGKAHGLEARMKGVNVLLGPCVGPIGRMPAGGRNWEGFGADPVLQGIAAAQTIKGIQENGVMVCILSFSVLHIRRHGACRRVFAKLSAIFFYFQIVARDFPKNCTNSLSRLQSNTSSVTSRNIFDNLGRYVLLSLSILYITRVLGFLDTILTCNWTAFKPCLQHWHPLTSAKFPY